MLKRRLKEPFGKAGLSVAILALVMAMVGGAFAANHAATASKAGKQGKQGKPGKTGPAGPAGAAGPAGPAGAVGPAGANGTNGAPGPAGKSVAVTTVNSPGCNGQAGAEVKQEGAASGVKVCNGTTGFTEALPKGKTEMGSFASPQFGTANANENVSISFPIPLAEPLDATHVHYVTAEEVENETALAACPGSALAPQAAEGNLCVYEGGSHPEPGEEAAGEKIEVNSITPPTGLPNEGTGASTAGAVLLVHYQGSEEFGELRGTFAVTGTE